uniref:hypothetical protein n=1 Tax=Stappia sp. TaxID=1870903 RepID=UPI003BA8BEBA
MTSRYPVTQHALLRYLTRVMEIDLAPYRARIEDPGDPTLVLEAFAEETGVCLAWLRKRVLPPELLPAVRTGATRVRVDGHVCVLCSGQVVTVYRHDRYRRSRIQSRSEMKRTLGRRARRVR